MSNGLLKQEVVGKVSPALEWLSSSKDIQNEIFSFLPGNTIVHKIGLLSKRARNIVTTLGFLTECRVITLKVGKRWPLPESEDSTVFTVDN